MNERPVNQKFMLVLTAHHQAKASSWLLRWCCLLSFKMIQWEGLPLITPHYEAASRPPTYPSWTLAEARPLHQTHSTELSRRHSPLDMAILVEMYAAS
jgi:hypothetical protein